MMETKHKKKEINGQYAEKNKQIGLARSDLPCRFKFGLELE